MKKRNRRLTTTIFFLIMLCSGSAIIFYNLKDNMVFFYSPNEIIDKKLDIDTKIRLGGMVKKQSIIKDSIVKGGNNVEEVTFVVTDFENEIKVKYIGILPDLFKEGQGVVVEGTVSDRVLKATEVLAKHDENYMPPEIKDIDSIKEKINGI